MRIKKACNALAPYGHGLLPVLRGTTAWVHGRQWRSHDPHTGVVVVRLRCGVVRKWVNTRRAIESRPCHSLLTLFGGPRLTTSPQHCGLRRTAPPLLLGLPRPTGVYASTTARAARQHFVPATDNAGIVSCAITCEAVTISSVTQGFKQATQAQLSSSPSLAMRHMLPRTPTSPRTACVACHAW